MNHILIIDDHLLFSQALELVLRQQNYKVTTITTGLQAINQLKEQSFDLVLLDLNLKDIHGEEVLKSSNTFKNKPYIIIVSSATNRASIERLHNLGANGFINKARDVMEMLSAIKQVLSGKNFFPQLVHSEAISPSKFQATPRQDQIIDLILQGSSTKEISFTLNITDGTVRQHLNTIYKLFGVNSRSQLLLKLFESSTK